MEHSWLIATVIAAVALFLILRLPKKGSPSPSRIVPGQGGTTVPSTPAVPVALMSRFKSALPDPGVRERLIARERSRFPAETESGLIERVLFTLERDRT